MADENEPPEALIKGPEAINPTPQRRIFGTRRIVMPTPESRPELEEKLNHLVDSVKVLQSHITGEQPLPAPPETDQKARRMRRFQRVGGEETPATEREPALEQEPRVDDTALNANIAWPRLSRAEETPVTAGERIGGFLRRHPSVQWIFAQVAGLSLLLLGFWGGESLGGDDEHSDKHEKPALINNAPVGDLLARAGVSDRAMHAADLGLAAERRNDLDTARTIWAEAMDGRLHLPGAEYRLALLDIRKGDLNAADIHLSNSLAAGEMMASCYFVNACFARQRSDYAKVASQFAQATRIEPFTSKFFFCWGEALRRAGKTQAGIDTIKQALERPASAADAELMDFKLRLARMESGHDEEFNKKLGEQLATATIPGDWLLLAAAQDLMHAAYPAAAAHLKDASRVLSRHTYEALVQDYLYQGYAARPEIGPLIKSSVRSMSATTSDPNGWPLEEADPATWTPFSTAL